MYITTKGLLFLTKLPPMVALDLAASIATYTLKYGIELPQSVTPFFGDVEGYDERGRIERERGGKPLEQGDKQALHEIKKMVADTCKKSNGGKEGGERGELN